jgi:hypothetical protein
MATIEQYKKRLEDSFDIYAGSVERAKELPEYGDLISVADWLNQVRVSNFIDYDGNGRLVMKLSDSVWVIGMATLYPSDITLFNLTLPKWATHVLWFNR